MAKLKRKLPPPLKAKPVVKRVVVAPAKKSKPAVKPPVVKPPVPLPVAEVKKGTPRKPQVLLTTSEGVVLSRNVVVSAEGVVTLKGG